MEQRAGAQAQGIEMCTAMCCMEQAASWEQPSPKPTEGVLLLPCLTALPLLNKTPSHITLLPA